MEHPTITDIQPLPASLMRKGCFYWQLSRNSKAAIYAFGYSARGRVIGFDTFRVLRYTPRADMARLAGTHTLKTGISALPEVAEKFPGDEAYGKTAWSFSSLRSALNKFDEMSGSGAR